MGPPMAGVREKTTYRHAKQVAALAVQLCRSTTNSNCAKRDPDRSKRYEKQMLNPSVVAPFRLLVHGTLDAGLCHCCTRRLRWEELRQDAPLARCTIMRRMIYGGLSTLDVNQVDRVRAHIGGAETHTHAHTAGECRSPIGVSRVLFHTH